MRYIFLMISLLLGSSLLAETVGLETVRLPQEKENFRNVSTQSAVENSNWKSFNDKYGEWNVTLDKFTETPVNAFGKAINLTSDNISNKNIKDLAYNFLVENKDVFNINPENFRFVKARKANKRWYVSFKQTYNDMDVVLSEIELRIFENGNLMAFRIKTYNDINIDAVPAISFEAAVNISLEKANTKVKLLSNDSKTYILPVFNGKGYSYKLVYKYNAKDNNASYASYVDANSGDVVWRFKTSHHVAGKVTTSGKIQQISPNSQESDAFFPYQKVEINGEIFYTDENGELDADINTGDIVKAYFEGKYGKISYQNGTPSVLVDTVDADGDYNIYWDNSNSNKYERFGYYHVNKIRNWITEIDPELTAMDIPVDVVFMDEYMNYGINAFSTEQGDTIAFIGYTNAESRLSTSPSVMYHEYGHGINTRLYKDLGVDEGMTNASLHEALADVTSSMILDDSRVGANVFKSDSNKVIRNIDNNNVYPDDIAQDSHYNGLILAGAIWDIRESVSLFFAKRVSHFARYGTPDDPDIGTAFSEYFIEFLVAADDDGDLSNGLPYADEIVKAFNDHGIGTNMIVENSFVHTPLEDTEVYQEPFEVDFSFDTFGLIGTEIDSAFVVYSLDNFESVSRIKADMIDFNQFTMDIPELDKPAGISYKFEYYFGGSSKSYQYPYDDDAYFSFLAGFVKKYFEDFEDADDWTLGDPDDDATQGIFEIADPDEMYYSYYGYFTVLFQNGDDHTPNGVNCLVTGAYEEDTYTMQFTNSLIDGVTSAISPKYDLSNTDLAFMRFYMWEMNFVNAGQNLNNLLEVYASNDDGNTWTNVYEHPYTAEGDWELINFNIPNQFLTENTKFKFTASPMIMNGSIHEVLIDDIEILIPVPGTSVVENSDEYISTYPNPFEGRVTIENNNYDAVIYDLTGNKVYELPNGISNWDGQDMYGREVESGVYIIRINTGTKVINKKIIKM